MPEIPAPLRAPELADGLWVQGPPVSLGFSRGAVVLVEIWEATCVNCLRTLPYVAAWHRRYAGHGLVVVGVHTPEFEVTRRPDVVAAAVAAEGIPYPVLLDAGAETWSRFANKYWPARYLADHRGYLRYEHFGEGAYAETEGWIQRLLREAGDEAPMPEPLAPLRPEDAPGAVCARPTAELYLGAHRGRLTGEPGYRPGEEVAHPGGGAALELEDGTFAARGRWRHEAEYLEAGEAGAELEIAFRAASANLVAEPPADGAGGWRQGRLEVELADWQGGGQPLPPALAGEDVESVGESEETAGGATVVRFARVRLLRILRSGGDGSLVPRRLVVRVLTPGLRLYAVSFTGCVVPRRP